MLEFLKPDGTVVSSLPAGTPVQEVVRAASAAQKLSESPENDAVDVAKRSVMALQSEISKKEAWDARIAAQREVKALERAGQPVPEELAKAAEPPKPPLLVGAATDLGFAEAFALFCDGNLRFRSDEVWLRWSGSRWDTDKRSASALFMEFTKAAEAEVKASFDDYVASGVLDQEDRLAIFSGADVQVKDPNKKIVIASLKGKHAKAAKLGSMKQEEASLKKLRAVPGIHLDARDFDSDMNLISVENGYLDIKEREFRDPDRNKFLSRRLGCEFDSEATCPKWEQFVSTCMVGREGLIHLLQEAFALTVTGNVSLQKVFFLYGEGSNGKSQTVEVLDMLMGSYACALPSYAAIHPLHGDSGELRLFISTLPGVRMVHHAEFPPDKRLHEEFLKSLSGGDKITGRRHHGYEVDFKPTANIWIYGNHRPTIRGANDSIYRRICFIPFDYRVPEKERVTDLAKKIFKEEGPGILNWALAGMDRLQARGSLIKPAESADFSEEVRHENDSLGRFLEEEIEEAPGDRIHRNTLYSYFTEWCRMEGEKFVPTLTKVSRDMIRRKYVADSGRHWVGIRRRPEALSSTHLP